MKLTDKGCWYDPKQLQGHYNKVALMSTLSKKWDDFFKLNRNIPKLTEQDE